jgi:hypothetical protein
LVQKKAGSVKKRARTKGVQVLKNEFLAGRWWLTPVILATQEAEIRRITVFCVCRGSRFEASPGK